MIHFPLCQTEKQIFVFPKEKNSSCVFLSLENNLMLFIVK